MHFRARNRDSTVLGLQNDQHTITFTTLSARCREKSEFYSFKLIYTKSTRFAPKRNFHLFTPRCSLGPSGLTYDTKSPYTSQESVGGFLFSFAGNGNIVKLHFTSFHIFQNPTCKCFLYKKTCPRHFARNLTIVSPNGARGGRNSSKCEKEQKSPFWRHIHFLPPKVRF